MNADIHLEYRAGSSQGKHEGEPSLGLCDRLDRTRDTSQRQLPTDHDYAVSTREYQTDQSSLKPAPTAARSVLEKQQMQRQRRKQPRRFAEVDTVTPYQRSSGFKEREESHDVHIRAPVWYEVPVSFGNWHLIHGSNHRLPQGPRRYRRSQ